MKRSGLVALVLLIAMVTAIPALAVDDIPTLEKRFEELKMEKEALKVEMAKPENAGQYDALKAKWDEIEKEMKTIFEKLNADKERKKRINEAKRLINDSKVKIQGRQYGEAIRMLKKAIELNPSEPKAYFRLGYTYQKNRQLKEALDAFTKTTELNSSHQKAHISRGLILDKMKQYNEAAEAFKAAASAPGGRPDDTVKALYLLGQTYLDQGKVDQSVGALMQAIQTDDTYSEAHFLLGKIYIEKKKDFASAIGELDKASKLVPKEMKYKVVLAEAYNKAGQYDQAVSTAQAAKSLKADRNPKFWKGYALFQLGWAYEMKGSKSEALKTYNETLKAGDSGYAKQAQYRIDEIQRKM